MLDPTKNATFEILDALFSELAEMFDGESSCPAPVLVLLTR